MHNVCAFLCHYVFDVLCAVMHAVSIQSTEQAKMLVIRKAFGLQKDNQSIVSILGVK